MFSEGLTHPLFWPVRRSEANPKADVAQRWVHPLFGGGLIPLCQKRDNHGAHGATVSLVKLRVLRPGLSAPHQLTDAPPSDVFSRRSRPATIPLSPELTQTPGEPVAVRPRMIRANPTRRMPPARRASSADHSIPFEEMALDHLRQGANLVWTQEQPDRMLGTLAQGIQRSPEVTCVPSRGEGLVQKPTEWR